MDNSLVNEFQAALALHKAGQLQRAEAGYRKILQVDPRHPDALHYLGLLARHAGKLDIAAELIGRAIEIRPSGQMYYNQGLLFQSQGKLDQAIVSYRQAVLLKPDFVEAYDNLGTALLSQGKIEEAVASHRQALVLKPDVPGAHFNLGNALRAQGKPDEAAASYRQAIALKPDFAEEQCNLGNALRNQGKLDEAMTVYRRAIELKPDLVQAHCQLATAQIEMGQFEAARSSLSKVPEADPGFPLAWALLAWSRKMTGEDEDWLNTALRLLSSQELPDKTRCTLLFALGKYYDDSKQYDLAFTAFQQANSLQRKLEGGFDRAAHARLVDDVIAAWPAGLVSAARDGASRFRLPVLVVGMMRSGTTLTEQIIASHPEAFGAGELSYWPRQFASNQAALFSGNYPPQLVSGLAQGYEQVLRRMSADAARIVDKMPHNFIHLGLIHEVFPQAKIIHVRRNPVDTCLSNYFHFMAAIFGYTTDLADIAFYYREYARLMAHWRQALPAECYMEVAYEDLVGDQAAWSRRIIEFIGLEWDERCLDFHQTDRRVETPSNWQVRQPIYQSSQARWRNYEKHLGPLLELLDGEDT